MIEPLLARLSTQITLVVGKGGVGKTTSAGAIALALADRGQRVHLISTDPAHSLADLFERQPAACSSHLDVEEFDARTYADAFFRRVQPALVTLIERGTYLAETDARSFLDLSIPGIDEVMAALRLVDLLRSRKRVVVDTAPTGHTLRLLESGAILRSWVAAGRAMADKATAVAEQLLRQDVRFEAESMLDEVAEAAAEFEDSILRESAFVVVTRHGRVVQEETERLTRELQRRGARIVATITDRATSPSEGRFIAPRLSPATGCGALRSWANGISQTPTTAPAVQKMAAAGNAAATLAGSARRLVWVAGKGGVGKSTCAAALAALWSATRNVQIVSTDPAGSLSEIFGTGISAQGTRVGPQLLGRQVDAIGEFDRMRSDYRDNVERVFASPGLETSAQLDRRVVEALFNFAPPGIDEIIALVEIMEHAADYDVTIIDSAPTGHFLRLLEMPEIALQWVHALMRLLVKSHAVGSLDALGENLLAFSKRLRQLKLDLSARETTAVYVVTLAEPMVTAETQRLCDALDRAHIPIAAIILNRADAGRTHTLPSTFRAHPVLRVPDVGEEIVGVTALRNFLDQWEIVGE
jgi:arsenite-transporting ATPase